MPTKPLVVSYRNSVSFSNRCHAGSNAMAGPMQAVLLARIKSGSIALVPSKVAIVIYPVARTVTRHPYATVKQTITHNSSSFVRPSNNPSGTVTKPFSLRPLDRRSINGHGNNDVTKGLVWCQKVIFMRHQDGSSLASTVLGYACSRAIWATP